MFRKTKDYTPRQVLKRFFMALTTVAIMLLVIIICSRKTDREREALRALETYTSPGDSISAKMDSLLALIDLEKVLGEGARASSAGQWRKMTEDDPHGEEIFLLRELTGNPAFEKYHPALRVKLDSLLALQKENPSVTYYMRRLRIRTADTTYVIAQTADTLLTETTLTHFPLNLRQGTEDPGK